MDNRENPAWAIKERPILFSAAMVLALRENRKTQTRRTCGLDEINAEPDAWTPVNGFDPGKFGVWAFCNLATGQNKLLRCPYGVAGDRLWTREAFALVNPLSGCEMNARPEFDGVRYRATWTKAHSSRWKPSIHMPRWASRDTLEVVSVRPERLQEISHKDALTEGSPLARFEALWTSINGDGSWSKNPWVWRIAFKRLTGSGKLPEGETTS